MSISDKKSAGPQPSLFGLRVRREIYEAMQLPVPPPPEIKSFAGDFRKLDLAHLQQTAKWWWNHDCREIKANWVPIDGQSAPMVRRKSCADRACEWCQIRRLDELGRDIDAVTNAVFENRGLLKKGMTVGDVLHLVSTLSAEAPHHADAILFATNFIAEKMSKDDRNRLNNTLRPITLISTWEATFRFDLTDSPPHKHRAWFIISQAEFGRERALELSRLVDDFYREALKKFYSSRKIEFNDAWVLAPRPKGFHSGSGKSLDEWERSGEVEGGCRCTVYSAADGVLREDILKTLRDYPKKLAGMISQDLMDEALNGNNLAMDKVISSYQRKKMKYEATGSRTKVAHAEGLTARQALEVLSWARAQGLMKFSIIEKDERGRESLWISDDSLTWRLAPSKRLVNGGNFPRTFGAFGKDAIVHMQSSNPYVQRLYERFRAYADSLKGTKTARVSSLNKEFLKLEIEKAKSENEKDKPRRMVKTEIESDKQLVLSEFDARYREHEHEVRSVINSAESELKTKLYELQQVYLTKCSVASTLRYHLNSHPWRLKLLEQKRTAILLNISDPRREKKADTLSRKIEASIAKRKASERKLEAAEEEILASRWELCEFIKAWPDEVHRPKWCWTFLEVWTKQIIDRDEKENMPPGEPGSWLHRKKEERLKLEERARKRLSLATGNIELEKGEPMSDFAIYKEDSFYSKQDFKDFWQLLEGLANKDVQENLVDHGLLALANNRFPLEATRTLAAYVCAVVTLKAKHFEALESMVGRFFTEEPVNHTDEQYDIVAVGLVRNPSAPMDLVERVQRRAKCLYVTELVDERKQKTA